MDWFLLWVGYLSVGCFGVWLWSVDVGWYGRDWDFELVLYWRWVDLYDWCFVGDVVWWLECCDVGDFYFCVGLVDYYLLLCVVFVWDFFDLCRLF